MKSFHENLKYIKNEFQEARWDETTGLSPEIMSLKIKEMHDTPTTLSRPIVCANAYAYLLDHVQLEINEHTPFSVKINTGVDYTYFASLDIFYQLYRMQNDEKLAELFPEKHNQMMKMKSVGMGYARTDFTHTVPNWDNLLQLGFRGILDHAEEAKKKLLESGEYNDKQMDFLDSVIICYGAILRLLNRIYEYSLGFDVPEFSQCIKNLISEPPKTLYEVMQFSVLYLYFEEVGYVRGRTLGHIDIMYLPYFRAELEAGKTKEEIAELFRYFFIHFTAAKRFSEQPFTICGCDKDGNDLSTELTTFILDVYDDMNIYDPKIHLRYHKNLDNKIFMKILSMIRAGRNSICIINDEEVFRGYERIGIPREDSQDYVLSGCYEPIIIGKEEAEIATNRFNLPKCIEFALNSGRDLRSNIQISIESKMDIASFEEFFDITLQHIDHLLDFEVDYLEDQGMVSTTIHPSPIYAAGFDECLKQGKDVYEYPLKYNNMSVKAIGLATLVDSLVAVKKYVFEKKMISLDELRTALRADWKGYEELQQKIVKDNEKYGNNLPVPDEIMTRITEHLEERYCAKELRRGGMLRLGLDSVYRCIECGERTAALPNGRNAGKPISKNVCASDGMDRAGITGYMQSISKINHDAYVGAIPLDFILHPSAVEGEKGLLDFASLIRVFFDNGGFAVQGNIVSQETLKDAQRNPEKYSTLQVRVCGWNEYFVKLSKVKQDMFIKQCEVSG